VKIVAHPLVVAAALGLLGPAAMEDMDEQDTVELPGGRLARVPSAEAQREVEARWLQARALTVETANDWSVGAEATVSLDDV
jgi:hypothetical protein